MIVRSKGAWATSRDLLLEFWDPLYISGMDKVRNFKFGVRIGRRDYKPKNCKSRSKGAWSTSRDLLFKFWDPLRISGMSATRDFKFGAPVDRRTSKPKKNAKVGQKGRGLRHVTYFLNFGIPSISLE